MTARSDATAAEIATARLSRPWLRGLRHEVELRPERRRAQRRARRPRARRRDARRRRPERSGLHSAALRGIAAGRRAGRPRRRPAPAAARTAASRSCSRGSRTGCAGAILRDGTRDTGCGLKAFRRDVYLALPYFDALHRFMPALVKREGLRDRPCRRRRPPAPRRAVELRHVRPALGRHPGPCRRVVADPAPQARSRGAGGRGDADPAVAGPRSLFLRRLRRALRLLARFRPRRPVPVRGPVHRAVDRERAGRQERDAARASGSSRWPAG